MALGGFFEIRTIVFAAPADGSRDIATPSGAPEGQWQETPLAYLLLATKDTTVDRVPALEIELDFFDREGKVIIPVPSNPLQIEISRTADEPQRPAPNIAVTQIVDSRELAENCSRSTSSPPPTDWFPNWINCSTSQAIRCRCWRRRRSARSAS